MLTSIKGNCELSDSLTVYCCIRKNNCLDAFLNHYRNLRVTRFILIDTDDSTKGKEFPSDVNIFKPNEGRFKTHKAKWINYLLNEFQERYSWCLTLDVDEFVDTPSLDRLKTSWCVKGYCIDMLPSDRSLSLSSFSKMSCDRYRSNPINFRENEFGESANLNKFFMFQYLKGLEVTQGFHYLTLHSGKIIHATTKVPIKHYIFHEILNNFEAPTDEYEKYHEIAMNKLRELPKEKLLDRLLNISSSINYSTVLANLYLLISSGRKRP